MQQVGRYQIIGELGRGAMGVVYKAQDPTIGRTIAIKSIRLQELTDETERERLRERLIREAQSAGILSHPGIVTIYDIAEENGMAYIFMEFVNGPPLEKLLMAERTPDKETLLSIFRQTAAALDYAHKKGIIHRDVKPANIMIHEDGTAKVTDFGVAKIVSQQMTQAGTMMGTPNYMSPEQVQGGAITGKADQFSLAVIAYEVLTGEKPFVAQYLPTLLYKIVREDHLAPQRINPTLGAPVELVMKRALAKNPAERYDTCVDFVNALAAACHSLPGWIPLPRGASQNMPTVGSQEGMLERQMAETIAEPLVQPLPPVPPPMVAPPAIPAAAAVRLPDPVAAPARPAAVPVAAPPVTAAPMTPSRTAAPPAMEPPVVPAAIHIDPRARHARAEASHILRNVIFAAAATVLVCLALLVWAGKLGGHHNLPPADATTTSPVPEATSPADPVPVPPVPAPAPQPIAQQPAPATPVADPPPTQPAPVPAAKLPPAPTEAMFQLTATPAGATAVFDNNSATQCTVPCSVTLSNGRHTLLVRSPGYRDASRILEIPRDPGLIVNLERMVGMLSLVTNPSGLAVFIDGQEQTRKTPATFALAPGPHRVEVVKGTERHPIAVEIHDGSTIERTVDWSP
ncbi:MAG TPA: serine/threonine-protein kinase [Bryobacteraceae bacterium]